jgi:hypothetical protein
MMKSGWFLLVFFFLFGKVFADGENNSTSTNVLKPRVAILKFENRSNQKKYPASGVYQKLIFKSLRNFIAPLRSLELIRDSSSADLTNLIVSGEYALSGKKSNPDIHIELKIRSEIDRKMLFKKSYRASTDRKIFDSIDRMVSDSAKIVLAFRTPQNEKEKIPIDTDAHIEKIETANLLFNNFKIGSEEYDLMLNGEILDSPRNNRFALKVNVVAGQEYQIKLLHKESGRVVLNSAVTLAPDETRNINYIGTGNVAARFLDNKEHYKIYSFFVDSKEIAEGSVLSNLWSGLNYNLKIKDNQSNVVYTNLFYLKDGELKELSPALEWKGGVHLKIYKTDDIYAGLGLDLFFFRYLWAGVGCGGGVFYDWNKGGGVPVLFPYADVGYYLIGDMLSNFRAGIGLTFHGYYLPAGGDFSDLNSALSSLFYGGGIFAIVEYYIFYIKPAVYYDLSKFYAVMAVGVKF